MKAIMYHYVREYNIDLPNFRFLDIIDFRKQLDYFDKTFGFLSFSDWDDYIRGGGGLSNKIILTFDDSMSCHYEYVFPELVRRGLWGIFYVPTKPYVEDKMLDVHKIHILCGKFTGDVLLKTCRSRISDEMVPFARRKEFKNFTYNKQNNDPSISIFKRLLNYYVSDEIKEYLIDQISNDLGFFDFPLSFYCSRSELYEMAKRGMVLGSHTVSHPVMSKLNSDKQHKEIISSFDFISKFPDQIHKTYCHPYGGFHSFDSETIRILNQEQVDYSFNVLPKDIDFKFNINDKHSLPRFDCNEFPFGAAS